MSNNFEIFKNLTKTGTETYTNVLFAKRKNTVPWTYVIGDLKGEEIVGTFYKNELQKTNQKNFRTEKIIKRKGNKLYVKWKGYNSSFDCWIDKKRHSINE